MRKLILIDGSSIKIPDSVSTDVVVELIAGSKDYIDLDGKYIPRVSVLYFDTDSEEEHVLNTTFLGMTVSGSVSEKTLKYVSEFEQLLVQTGFSNLTIPYLIDAIISHIPPSQRDKYPKNRFIASAEFFCTHSNLQYLLNIKDFHIFGDSFKDKYTRVECDLINAFISKLEDEGYDLESFKVTNLLHSVQQYAKTVTGKIKSQPTLVTIAEYYEEYKDKLEIGRIMLNEDSTS